MNTTNTGRSAEDRVAKYLESQAYRILDRNWRTRWCEIDIVAERGECVFFIEVKYRQKEAWGDGFDAITSQKLSQMKHAVSFWLASHDWSGEVQLVVASVDGLSIDLRFVEE